MKHIISNTPKFHAFIVEQPNMNPRDMCVRQATVGRAVRKLATDLTGELSDVVDLFVNVHPCDLLDAELFSKTALTSRAARVVMEISERASSMR